MADPVPILIPKTPIWKDTYYTTTAYTLDYYIRVASGSTIFSGRAYKYPDSENLEIKVNDICSSYLDSKLSPNFFNMINGYGSTGHSSIPNALKTFELCDSADTVLSRFEFYNDWSYDKSFQLTTSGTSLGTNITDAFTSGMIKLHTVYEPIGGGTDICINWAYLQGDNPNYMYSRTVCSDYAIYYCNSYGGWFSYVPEGKIVESKDMEFFNYKKSGNNTKYGEGNREEVRFQTNYKPNWEVNTSWLTDAESKNLYNNLLSSNYIYLHNIKDNKIYPVHIVDTSVTKKTFEGERTLINYTINFESDNTLIRK